MHREMLSRLVYVTGAFQPDKGNGRCHICGTKGPLSWEHIPPRSAFNNCDALWDRLVIPDKARDSARQVRVRGGFRVRTICKTCNNGRCSTYAAAYVSFVRHLVESPRLFDSSGYARLVSIPCDTLLLAKEIAAMILALEPFSFGDHNPHLRRFVLDERVTLHPRLKVLGFLVPDVRQAGTINRFHARVETFAAGYGFIGGEISWFPFGIVYAAEIGHGYGLDGLTDVTRWFTVADSRDRRNDVVSLRCRVTGVDSIQCGVGRQRVRPQIDYV